MQIGILLTTSPEHENTFTVAQMASAFLEGNHAVDLYLMEDGIYNAVRNQDARNPLHAPLDALMKRGVKTFLCAVTAEARGIQPGQCLEGVEFSSQLELSQIVDRSDRFLAFH